jgi:hypothetical protein
MKGKINRNVYSQNDLNHGLAAALAVDLPGAKALQAETACGTSYAAFSAQEKAVLAAARSDSGLGDSLNAGLSGQLDKVEAEQAVATPPPPTAAPTNNKDLAVPDRTVQHVRQMAAALTSGDFLQTVLSTSLKRRATALQADADEARAATEPDRAPLVKKATEKARQEEVLLAAVQELKNRDFVQAYDMFNGLASGGDADAQLVVGYLLSEALGTKRDYQEALTWLKRAAAQNYAPAKVLIGLLIFSGRGAKADTGEALRWIDSAYADGWTCTLSVKECHQAARGSASEGP